MIRYPRKDFAHGIMFHHFASPVHPRGQGAITAEETAAMIEFLGPDRILGAEEWTERARNNTLEDHHLCITFDDSLLCQYDVAWPVLNHYGITGFFFVYSSVFQGIVEPLEIYRYFRTVAFANVDEFYNAFFEAFDGLFPEKRETGLRGVDIDSYLKDYPFFTRTDRVFRFLRDEVLITPEYNKIMDSMIEAAGFDIGKIAQKLWMTEAQLTDLHVNRNIIGLHSYSHPLAIARLQKAQQKDEYTKNFSHLSGLLGSVPKTMSHPSNSYSGETLEILNEMEVDVGFRADMVDIPKRSLLEIPREDHANILRMMQA